MSSSSVYYIDNNESKTSLIRKISSSNDIIILAPVTENGLNIVFFVVDVFRRNGHVVDTLYTKDNLGIYMVIYPHNNIVHEKQITRETNIHDEIEMENIDKYSIIVLKACGTAISKAWMYSRMLFNSGNWFYLRQVNINAIPVKIENKTIFKTTVRITMQRNLYDEF